MLTLLRMILERFTLAEAAKQSFFYVWVAVLLLVLLPNIICAAIITVQGLPRLQKGLPSWLCWVLSPFLFLFTASTFPILVCLLVGLNISGAGRQESRLLAFWLTLDITKVTSVWSGLTACIEDVTMLAVFTTAFLTLSLAPQLAVNLTYGLYIPLYSFWLTMATSGVHILMETWKGWGNVLKHRSLRWVGPAFRDLYGGGGQDHKEVGASLEQGDDGTSDAVLSSVCERMRQGRDGRDRLT